MLDGDEPDSGGGEEVEGVHEGRADDAEGRVHAVRHHRLHEGLGVRHEVGAPRRRPRRVVVAVPAACGAIHKLLPRSDLGEGGLPKEGVLSIYRDFKLRLGELLPVPFEFNSP